MVKWQISTLKYICVLDEQMQSPARCAVQGSCFATPSPKDDVPPIGWRGLAGSEGHGAAAGVRLGIFMDDGGPAGD